MNNRQLMVFASAVLLLPCLARSELPQYDAYEHLGVQSCAASSCHGSAGERSTYAVLQNEYVTWARHDLHAKAYAVLKNEQSQRIARNLGLESAHTAKICLDCHTDNVPRERRGLQFQLSDGVACEACHGGAEKWLGVHISGGSNKHAKSLEAGMYPTEDPEARADLCLSCHLGTEDKFTTHRIMGAGHPRLSFDLQKFTDLQPRHYRVDADYRARKNYVEDTRAWALGQVKAARAYMSLLQGPRLSGNGLFPELSLFDCHACHHAFEEHRWQANERSATPPGTVLLNDSSLAMSQVIASVVTPGAASAMSGAIRDLHVASQSNMTQLRQVAAKLDRQLAELGSSLKGREFGQQQNNSMIDALSRAIGEARFSDYSDAEQATMALDVYSGATGRYKTEVDALYEAVADVEISDVKRFNPVMFAAVFNSAAGPQMKQPIASVVQRAPAPPTRPPQTRENRPSTRPVDDTPETKQPSAPVQVAQVETPSVSSGTSDAGKPRLDTVTPTHSVDTRALRVRYSPDAGSGVVGMVYKGDQIQVLEHRGQWARIAYKTRSAIRFGWVASSLITKYTAESELVSSEPVAPGNTAPLVTSSPQSSQSSQPSQGSRPAQTARPSLVSQPSDEQFVPTHIANTEVLRVRFTPSTSARIAVLLQFGEPVQLLSQPGEWSQIAYLNNNGAIRSGWVASRLIQKGPPTAGSGSTSAAPKPVSQPAPAPIRPTFIPTHVVNANALRVRGAADDTAVVLSIIYFGDEVRELSTSDGWSQVHYTAANGLTQQGWIASKYLDPM